MISKSNYRGIRVLAVACMAAAFFAAAVAGSHDHEDHADHGASHDVEEHIAQLNKMCGETAEARAARQAEAPLYDRLGGYDKISALTTEIVNLHEQNEAIKHVMVGVEGELLAKHDADFLAAGGDIVKAMQSFDYGEEEIQEVMCILVSLKDQVVLN